MLENLRQKITFRKIIGFVMSLTVVALVGLFQLIVADFSLEAFKSSDFYIRIIYRVVIIIMVYQCVVNLLFDKQIASKRVQDARAKYITAVKLKDISFQDFLKKYNYNLKAEAWTNKIDKEINKYNRKLENGRNVKKYSKKVEYLESLKTPEYIERNWAYLDCKWKPVYTGDFSAEDSFGTASKRARSEFNKDVARMSMNRVASYVLLSVILGLMVVNLAFESIRTAAFWFNMLADIIIVIIRASDAGFQLPIIIDDNFTNVYLYKVEIMQEYMEWCLENNIEESKAHKIFNYIQSVEADKPNEKEDKE